MKHKDDKFFKAIKKHIIYCKLELISKFTLYYLQKELKSLHIEMQLLHRSGDLNFSQWIELDNIICLVEDALEYPPIDVEV